MKKQTFIFDFPQAKATINVEVNPLCVKDTAIKYLKRQDIVFGTLCLIKDDKGNVLAVACYAQEDSAEVKFFTEDESINELKIIEESEHE